MDYEGKPTLACWWQAASSFYNKQITLLGVSIASARWHHSRLLHELLNLGILLSQIVIAAAAIAMTNRSSCQAMILPGSPLLEEGEAWQKGCSNGIDDETGLNDGQSGGHSCSDQAPHKTQDDPEVEVPLQRQRQSLRADLESLVKALGFCALCLDGSKASHHIGLTVPCAMSCAQTVRPTHLQQWWVQQVSEDTVAGIGWKLARS